MKIRIRKLRAFKVKYLLFILLILTYCLTTSDQDTAFSSMPKYIVLMLCIMNSAYAYKKMRKKNRYMYKEFLGLRFFIIVITMYSLTHSLFVLTISFRTVQELVFLILPMIYAYFVINTWSKEEIDMAFRDGLVVSFICYLLSLDMNLQQIYTALITSSFTESYSELESFVYPGLALSFCLYFCYYNRNKMYTFLSVFFVFMTFKRMFILMSIILLVFSNLKFRELKVSKKIIYASIVFLFLFAIFYYQIMLPDNVQAIENRFGIDVSKLTSTRSDRMRWLVNSSYKSYGFGSSTEYMYNRFYGALEMDASKIIIELGYIPLLLLFSSYMKIAKANFYIFTFMLFQLMNLILSSGLTGSFAWCLIFITISVITVYPEKKGSHQCEGKKVNKYNSASL